MRRPVRGLVSARPRDPVPDARRAPDADSRLVAEPNGVGSVAGTTLAVIIAMSFGFSRVAALAAVLYAVGAMLLLRATRLAGADPPP